VNLEESANSFQPPTLSRHGLLAVSAVMALSFVIIVGLGAFLYIDLRDIASTNRESIQRLDRLEHPPHKVIVEAVLRALRDCKKQPKCRSLFRAVIKRSTIKERIALAKKIAHNAAKIIGNPHADTSRPRSAPRTQARPRAPRERHGTSGKPGTSRPSGGSAPSGSGSGGSGSDVPSSPPNNPVVGITTNNPVPLPNPQLCTGTISINCP
jgi:uncharacterized membrane protein YgcG